MTGMISKEEAEKLLQEKAQETQPEIAEESKNKNGQEVETALRGQKEEAVAEQESDEEFGKAELKRLIKGQKVTAQSTRGEKTTVESVARENVILMYGCKPSKAVLAETTMVADITSTLENRFHRNTLSLKIPAAFEHLKGNDANFEMVTSNTLQPLNLHFHHNIVTKSLAYIFVSEKCKSQLPISNGPKEEVKHIVTALKKINSLDQE